MKNESDAHKTWYSSKEIADYLGISKGTLYKMTKQNKIPFQHVGKLLTNPFQNSPSKIFDLGGDE